MRMHTVLCFLATAFSASCFSSEAIETAVDQARQTRLSGDYGAAVRQLNAVLESQPKHFRALYNLALAHAVNNKQSEAQSAFERANQLLPQQAKPDYSFYNSFGWFLLTTGQLDAADAQFKTAMQYFDQLPVRSQSRLLNNYGLLNLQLDRMTDAERLFKQAAEEYGNPLAQRNLRLVKRIDNLSERWTVVFGADRTEAAAGDEIRRATTAGVKKPFVVLRDGFYRSVASFEDRGDAEDALAASKIFRPDAYIVAWESWCPDNTAELSRCKTNF